jgi:hypothetical protein
VSVNLTTVGDIGSKRLVASAEWTGSSWFIQGHAPRTEGEKYGEVTPDAMFAEIQKHPRYEVKAALMVDRRKKQRHREADSSDP